MAASLLASHSSFWEEEEDKQVNSPAESAFFYQKEEKIPKPKEWNYHKKHPEAPIRILFIAQSWSHDHPPSGCGDWGEEYLHAMHWLH